MVVRDPGGASEWIARPKFSGLPPGRSGDHGLAHPRVASGGLLEVPGVQCAVARNNTLPTSPERLLARFLTRSVGESTSSRPAASGLQLEIPEWVLRCAARGQVSRSGGAGKQPTLGNPACSGRIKAMKQTKRSLDPASRVRTRRSADTESRGGIGNGKPRKKNLDGPGQSRPSSLECGRRSDVGWAMDGTKDGDAGGRHVGLASMCTLWTTC